MDQLSFQTVFFWLVAGLTGLSAVAVVVSQNIVRSAAWLLFTLAGTSALYFLLGADFVAATQLIVYVGGVLVLVVFGVMLTAQGPFITMKASPAEWAISLIAGLFFLTLLIVTITRASWPQTMPPLEATSSLSTVPDNSMSSVRLGESLLGVNDATRPANLTGLPAQENPVTGELQPSVIRRTPMNYLLPFEIVSVHLLVVLIGAAYLARAKRRKEAVS
jgi:NADH:ubiquinone oxidoreductase subunit 6 (subunit J)